MEDLDILLLNTFWAHLCKRLITHLRSWILDKLSNWCYFWKHLRKYFPRNRSGSVTLAWSIKIWMKTYTKISMWEKDSMSCRTSTSKTNFISSKKFRVIRLISRIWTCSLSQSFTRRNFLSRPSKPTWAPALRKLKKFNGSKPNCWKVNVTLWMKTIQFVFKIELHLSTQNSFRKLKPKLSKSH